MRAAEHVLGVNSHQNYGKYVKKSFFFPQNTWHCFDHAYKVLNEVFVAKYQVAADFLLNTEEVISLS